MNRQTLLFFLIMMTASLLLMQYLGPKPQQQAVKPNPAPMFEIAKKQLEAGDYKAAYKTYDQIANKNVAGGTQDGAKALLLKAEAFRSAKGKARDERQALETYKTLVRQYGEQNKFPEVAQAQREMDALKDKLDREASTHWLYRLMDSLVGVGRSLGMGTYAYAFALLLLTLLVKIVTWPLSTIQYKGMRDMQRIQPLLKEIQEKYKGNPKELNTKTMETYKKEGVNPLMGCLPLLVQFPVLIFVYQAIMKYEHQFQNGVFLWITPSMHSVWSYIGANLSQPDIPLVVLYTISMFLTQKLTVVDPSQAQQQKMMSIMMPLMFAFFFWKFASAFLLYWLMLNIVMTLHQFYVMKSPRHAPAAPAQPAVVEPSRHSSGAPRSSRKRKK